MHHTPWLLATSLPHHRGAGTRIKCIYAQRMQIEETIRDLKCHRFGFALRYARTKRAERLETLLLVAALASFILWLPGVSGGAKVDHGSGGTVPLRRSKTLPLCEPFPVTGRVGRFIPWSCIARSVWRAGTG